MPAHRRRAHSFGCGSPMTPPRFDFVHYRLPLIVGVQLLLATLSLFASYVLRFDVMDVSERLPEFVAVLPHFLGAKLVVFYAFGLYRGWWRYVGMSDLLDIVKASLASVPVVYFLVGYASGVVGFSRSIYLMDAIITIGLLGGVRFAVRVYTESIAAHERESHRSLIVVGAGRAGRMLVREIRHNPAIPMRVVGFVDDDRSKHGARLEGVRILGSIDRLPELARELGVRDVLIAIPTATGEQMAGIVRTCQKAGVSYKTVPAIADVINGRFSLAEVRDVRIEDLLGRDVVEIDNAQIRRSLADKVVLITGAGGSIGSELSRQVAAFGPRRLVLFERSENDLYHIDLELRRAFPALEIVPIAGDILDVDRLTEVFFEFRPAVVMHAAAYKHVPMMERQPFAALRNNVFGTFNLANVAHRYGAESFLLISTDKAVNPVNIMGVSKRLAELVVLSFAGLGRGRFNAVRFGNVLGSNGSVVPLFKEQIAARQPVTVTHPEVTRYFMTIPESVRLVLQASTMGAGGEIFVLDMGRPVRIADLARNLIRLSGLEPDKDVPVVFTGLRPGEKLFEELLLSTEGLERTHHPKVMQLRGDLPRVSEVYEQLQRLEAIAEQRDVRALLVELRKLVPEYVPSQDLAALCRANSGSLLTKLEQADADEQASPDGASYNPDVAPSVHGRARAAGRARWMTSGAASVEA